MEGGALPALHASMRGGGRLSKYISRRIAAALPVFVIVGIVVFLLMHLTPGDPAAIILGPEATPEQVATLRRELGLDRPIWVQFANWFMNLVRGDWGTSIFMEEPVLGAIWQRLGPTVSLTTLALVVQVLMGIPLGIVAAWKKGTILDQLFISVAVLGVSIPSFWFGLILIFVVAVKLGWLPVAGYVPLGQGFWPWLSHLILPATVLGLAGVGLIARMLRDGMIDVLGQDYIRTARAKGVNERLVLMRHALRNAVLPTLTVVGNIVAHLLGGAIVTEQVFALPGIGQLVVDSVARRDYPVIQGAVLFIASVYIAVNLVVDLLYAIVDPRIRYE